MTCVVQDDQLYDGRLNDRDWGNLPGHKAATGEHRRRRGPEDEGIEVASRYAAEIQCWYKHLRLLGIGIAFLQGLSPITYEMLC